jgi:hypothetical protein
VTIKITLKWIPGDDVIDESALADHPEVIQAVADIHSAVDATARLAATRALIARIG